MDANCTRQAFLNMQTFLVFGDPCIISLSNIFIFIQLYLFKGTSAAIWQYLKFFFWLNHLNIISGRFVLMNKIPGRHFLSHTSSNILYTASCTVRVFINEYAFVSLYHVHWNNGFLSPLHHVLVLPRLHSFALNTFLLWKTNYHIYQCFVVVMYWLNIEVRFPCFK